MYKCNNCDKQLNEGDKVYQDGYFGSYHCSWEHLVDFMSDFFYVEKGKTIVIGEDE